MSEQSRMRFIEASRHPSALVLILVNIFPIIGIMFFDWDIFSIILLYWMESAVIGFFNILKMVRIGGSYKLNLIPFFIVHYSLFMFAHLFFIIVMFKPELELARSNFDALIIVAEYFSTIVLGLLFIFISHGFSFFYNFLGQKEHVGVSLKQQMAAPYKRIIIMHLVIILSGFLAARDGATSMALFLLVFLKLVTDLVAHIREHKKVIAQA